MLRTIVFEALDDSTSRAKMKVQSLISKLLPCLRHWTELVHNLQGESVVRTKSRVRVCQRYCRTACRLTQLSHFLG
jgi:hypothetical protein